MATNRNYKYLLLLALVIVTACKQKKKIADKEMPTIPVVITKKPASSFIDTLQITGTAAVFFNPDSIQWQQLKKNTDPQVFDSNQHDCYYQQRNARIVIKKDWRQVKITEAVNKRFLHFISPNQAGVVIDLNGKNDWCGILLFKEGKQPQLVDMTNIETALYDYFGK